MDFDHSVEIELKFKLSSKEIESVVSSSFFQERFTFSFKKTNTTTYFDTSSFDLRKNKIAIRIRESEGYKEQTIKIPIGEIDTIQKCHEISSPIESSEPDLSTIKKETVPGDIDLNQYHGSLKPIFITSIERTQWVYSENGQTLFLCIDKGKITYNINGDTAASAIAKKLKSRRLLLMTNVEGVYDDRKNLISEIKPFDIENLVKLKIVQGGMIPKIKNCIDAVENGVRGVVILDGRKPHSILDEIFSDKGSGTLIRK